MRKARRFISRVKQVFLVSFSLTFPRFLRISKNRLSTSLTKPPNTPDKYNLESVINYYSSFTITDDFFWNNTSEDKALKIV